MTQIPIVDSVLDASAIAARILSRYRLAPPVACQFLQRGLNDTYVVRTGGGTFYFRVYRAGWRTRPQIEAEVAMLDHLRGHGQPVSWPVARTRGGFLNKLSAPGGARYGVLFTEAAGAVPEVSNAWSRRYGTLVARLHQCLDELPHDGRRFHLDVAHLLEQPLLQVQPFLPHRPRDCDYLAGLADELASRISSLPTVRPFYGWCHGDLGGNFHEDASGRTVLFDFDCGGYGWRAYDLALFQWMWAWASFCQGWGRSGGVKRAQRWAALREGYAEVRDLTDAEDAIISSCVAARHLWLLGLHCRLACTHGGGHLDDGYFDHHLAFIKSWMKSSGARKGAGG